MNIRCNLNVTRILVLTAAALPLLAQTPSVVIDGPTPGTSISGTVTVSGWAIDNMTAPGTAIGSVVVMVDGVAAGNATTGISRPDVCTLFPARPGCPNVGWAFSLNTATLSAGGHTITVVATDTDPLPDSGSATVQVNVGAVPAVVIDSPTVGAVVTGTINVTGWAIDTNATGATAISAIAVQIDHNTIGTATYGLPRPDVCTSYPNAPSCPNVGYTYALNTSSLSPGPHVLTVIATDSDGVPDSGAATQTINIIAPPSVMIDSLTPGATVSGNVTVSGWALDSISGVGSAIGGVQILVDGNAVGNATYGSSRPDVCTTYPGRPGCPNVGFTYTLSTKSIMPGAHAITAVATDTDLTPDTGSWTVNVTVVALPTVTIETPAAGNVSGGVIISGWALDNSSGVGTAISSVKVSIDGSQVGSAFYGISRPEICNLYPGRPSCPNVGFSYNLDSTTLAPGSHTISVTATDSDSSPDSNTASVIVNVGAHSNAFNIDTPTNGALVSGVVMVTGWAIPPAGSQINAVKVFVDDNHVGIANFGISRPDACAGNPTGYGCPNVGFSFALDTSSLTAGAHSITVVASIQDGAPPVGYGTVNVTVAGH